MDGSRPSIPPGDPANGAGVCDDGLFCDEDATCQERGLTGAGCTLDDGCVSGLCHEGRCATPPASCLGDPAWLSILVLVSAVFPIRLRLRRARAR